MIILAYIFSILSLLMSSLYLIKLKFPNMLLMFKLLAVVLAPFWAVSGALGAILA